MLRWTKHIWWRSSVNNNVNDTTIYGRTSKCFDDQRLADELSSDLALNSKWAKSGCLHSMPWNQNGHIASPPSTYRNADWHNERMSARGVSVYWENIWPRTHIQSQVGYLYKTNRWKLVKIIVSLDFSSKYLTLQASH